MMRELLLALAIVAGVAFLPLAHAEPSFTYACEIIVDLRYETHLVKIDEQKKTLKWRGKTYQITQTPDCAKYGWHVTGSGTSFNFCTATKGVASFDGQPKSVADTYSEHGVNCSSFIND
jgi:hypothetical protein